MLRLNCQTSRLADLGQVGLRSEARFGEIAGHQLLALGESAAAPAAFRDGGNPTF